jgi:hypothetical protein
MLSKALLNSRAMRQIPAVICVPSAMMSRSAAVASYMIRLGKSAVLCWMEDIMYGEFESVGQNTGVYFMVRVKKSEWSIIIDSFWLRLFW